MDNQIPDLTQIPESHVMQCLSKVFTAAKQGIEYDSDVVQAVQIALGK